MRGYDPSFFINKKKVLLTHMSGTFKFKRIYSEGVAAEHPDVAGQKEFANKADAEITRRRKERAKKGGPQLPGFVASVKKEETELDEEKRPFPFEKVEAKKEKVKKGSVYGRGRDNNSPISDSEMEATRRVNKMSIVSAAETRKKQKADRNEEFELGEETLQDKKEREDRIAARRARVRELTQAGRTMTSARRTSEKAKESRAQKRTETIEKRGEDILRQIQGHSGRVSDAPMGSKAPEKQEAPEANRRLHPKLRRDTLGSAADRALKTEAIDVGADAGATISDFVHSKSKTFKGDSKKQRIKRALGAYYAAQKEETENIYDYVIEALVDADFAQDYETAENMFEHMSDEFVAVILEEYIEEKARGTRPKKTIHAYDVDETLFGHGKKGKPNVQVHVNDASGKRIQSLSNQEFNTHKLDKDKGHSYDFSEFQSAKTFSKTSTPNKKTIKDVRRKQARGQNVHIITARSKFDNPSEFQGHLKKHGIDVPMNKIHYTGGMKGSDVGKKKVDTAKGIAKQSGAKTTHMYDDAAKVNNAFEKEKQNNPTSTKIKTHLAKPNASGETTLRSYQATKGGRTSDNPSSTIKQTQRARKKARKNMGEEVSSYDYWKQFVEEDVNVNTGSVLGSLDKLARDTAGKVGEKIGRNKTGNIPIVSDIGGAVGRQKGTDMYDKVTAPFRKEEVSSYDYWKQFVD
jgi:hypothetical protein